MGPWVVTQGNQGHKIPLGELRDWASMGPWVVTQGNSEIIESEGRDPDASMGPWVVTQGNLPARYLRLAISQSLQWGPGL